MQINLAFLRTGTKNKEYIQKKSRQAALEIGVTIELHIVVSVQRLHILRMCHLDSLPVLSNLRLNFLIARSMFSPSLTGTIIIAYTSFLRTQGRDRTGTVSHWCLRPTRLPIPPPGLAFGKKVAMVYTAPLNKRATSASALPKN